MSTVGVRSCKVCKAPGAKPAQAPVAIGNCGRHKLWLDFGSSQRHEVVLTDVYKMKYFRLSLTMCHGFGVTLGLAPAATDQTQALPLKRNARRCAADLCC